MGEGCPGHDRGTPLWQNCSLLPGIIGDPCRFLRGARRAPAGTRRAREGVGTRKAMAARKEHPEARGSPWCARGNSQTPAKGGSPNSPEAYPYPGCFLVIFALDACLTSALLPLQNSPAVEPGRRMGIKEFLSLLWDCLEHLYILVTLLAQDTYKIFFPTYRSLRGETVLITGKLSPPAVPGALPRVVGRA
jgi:hypothetical protein